MMNAGETDVSPIAIERYLIANLSEYSTAGSILGNEVISEVFNAFYGRSIQNDFAKEFMSILPYKLGQSELREAADALLPVFTAPEGGRR